MVTVIELDSIDAIKQHGNLFNSSSAWIQRTFGSDIKHIYSGIDCGTIQLVNGDCVDYWRDDSGKFEFHDAK